MSWPIMDEGINSCQPDRPMYNSRLQVQRNTKGYSSKYGPIHVETAFR